jgi:hypothetical protein
MTTLRQKFEAAKAQANPEAALYQLLESKDEVNE